MELERWGWYSVAVNVLLAGLHGVIAAASGSLAVAGEMTHNLADLLAAVAVLVGIRLAGRKSRAFPYGLYKVENMIALGLAGLVLITAYEIGRNALLAPPASVRAEPWMFALLLLSTAIPLVFSHFELRAGRAAHSPALVADAREYRVHGLTTGLAILALASAWLGLPLDRISALLIVLVVLKMGWELLRDAMRVLLDASMEPDTLSRVREVIDADPLVTEVKWVTGRNAGRYRFVEAGLALRGASREKVENGVRRIEAAVRKAVPRVERVLLQVEPASSPWVRYAVPLANSGGLVSDHFGEAPCFAILAVRRDDHTVEERREALNPCCDVERGKGMRVAEWLVAQKVDVVLSHEDLHDKGPAYVFRDAGVELRMTKARDTETAVGAA